MGVFNNPKLILYQKLAINIWIKSLYFLFGIKYKRAFLDYLFYIESDHIAMKNSFDIRLKQMGRKPTEYTLNLQNSRLSNKYVIFDLIAVGTRSTIYYGIEEATGQERAFKFYNLKQIEAQQNFNSKQRCKKFSNYQYSIMKKCKSLHLLKCLDIFQDRSYKMLIYEYCNMGSLKHQIRKRQSKQIDQLRAIVILKQILSGLKSMHSDCHIIHKNLKSENIFIRDGIYKIIDFGIPKINSEKNQQDCNFVVPQIILTGTYSEKADVWSVGVLFYQILSGKLPQVLIGQNKQHLISDKLQNIFTSKQEFSKLYSPQVCDFLQNCLYTNPDHRMAWQSLEKHLMLSMSYKPPIAKDTKKMSEQQQDEIRLTCAIIVDQNSYQDKSEYSESLQCVEIGSFLTSSQQQFYLKKFDLQQERQEIQKYLTKDYERKGQYFQIMQIEQVSESFFRKKINTQQHKMYRRIRSYYFECLKVQFIMGQIITPLTQMTIKKDRYVVEFIYLLLSRCFAEMSQINIFVKESKKGIYQNILMACIMKITQKLYSSVQKLLNQYSQKLNVQQNKVTNMFADQIRKIKNKQNYHAKQKFLCGIEKIDYGKQEQIQFTYIFYRQKVQTLLQKKQLNSMLRYMSIYKQIWNIPSQKFEQFQYLKCYIDKSIIM